MAPVTGVWEWNDTDSRKGREGDERGVSLCVDDQIYFERGEKPTENFCVRIKGRAGKGVIRVGVCCRLSDQDNWVSKGLYTEKGADFKYWGIKSMSDEESSKSALKGQAFVNGSFRSDYRPVHIEK